MNANDMEKTIEISEDYVSFETAKLLKEKGFDSDEVGCLGGFYSERCYESGYGIKTNSGKEVGIVYDDLRNCELDYDEYLRPTLQMVMKWLREIHSIFICILFLEDNGKYGFTIENTVSRKFIITSKNDEYPTYEQTCEAAIKYCLEKLI